MGLDLGVPSFGVSNHKWLRVNKDLSVQDCDDKHATANSI